MKRKQTNVTTRERERVIVPNVRDRRGFVPMIGGGRKRSIPNQP